MLIVFTDKKALLLNNAEWMTRLEYIPFLRDIGRHFSINKMIKAESYKKRLESEEGLSFIEFNYMILQAYDFLVLFDTYGCMLQMGGSDQWGNIVAGIELVRKVRQKTVFGMTFPLITTSSGEKMGKTAKGAVWLDPKKTSPYEYYQYWINTDDRDVTRFLSLFTFLPTNEIKDIENDSGAELNMAKTILAFETTVLAHGYHQAVKAYEAASSVFGKRMISKNLFPSSKIPRNATDSNTSSVPTSKLEKKKLMDGIPAFKLFHLLSLCSSRGNARRLIEQGGAYVNGKRIKVFDDLITLDDTQDNEIMLRAGKKKFHRILLI
jgi:tyrosyl-tRNA synthetase